MVAEIIHFRRIERRFGFLAIGLCLFLMASAAEACGGGIILDAETDALLRGYSEPLLKASGLGTVGGTDVVLSGVDEINAFASPGCVVIHSGLLFEAENPGELRGVIAHEIGHLAGGHITALKQQIEEYTLISLASTILGLGLLAAGLPDPGMLVIAGGSGVGIGRFLQHSRTQESSADNAALSFLERTGESGLGLISFFRKLASLEGDYEINPYMSTHPLSQERISYLQQRALASPYANSGASPADRLAFDMLQAKIFAFFRPPEQTLRRYLPSDRSLPARYAHAVMHTRTRNYNQALAETDMLLAEVPDNPFLYEWRGYILTNAGRAGEAITSYERALELAPNNLILHLEIGLALTATENEILIRRGLRHLQRAAEKGGQAASLAWRNIARAQESLGNRGQAELATAESAYFRQSYFTAITHASRARAILPQEDKQAHLRAVDIQIVSCSLLEQQKEQMPEDMVDRWRNVCTAKRPSAGVPPRKPRRLE